MALKQLVSWPGAGAVESLSYTASHGISPGVATLVTIPRPTDRQPAEFGDLVWGDGQRTARIRDCAVAALGPRRDAGGTSWVITIFDRRWRWRMPQAGFGQISGRYNLRDGRGKLVPWTIRSPVSLAKLCLSAMGETRYELDMPDGLDEIDAGGLQRYFELGENVRQSMANPTVQWDYTPPAEALARLCELFGRRLVFQPLADKVVIAKLGEGSGLPGGVYSSDGATMDTLERPRRVCVAGAPIKFQYRLLLEAVGEEWNGSVVPIDDLTYKPEGRVLGGQKQVVTFTWGGAVGEDGPVEVVIRLNLPSGLVALYTFRASDGGSPRADNVASIVAQINASPPPLSAMLIASSSGESLTLTGRTDGVAWGTAEITDPLVPANAEWTGTSQIPMDGQLVGGWNYCGPPNYTAAKATDRLAFDQARELARKSVYRYYRVVNADPATGKAPLDVPHFGKLARRHQIVLLPGKVDQVVPEPRDPRGGDKGRPGQNRGAGILPEFYDGYSRDQGPDVYGSVSRLIGSVLWSDGARGNTLVSDKVRVPFAVVPEKQMIAFSAPVYARPSIGPIGERYEAPSLRLETAFHLMDAKTSALVRPEYTRDLGGAGGEEWQIHDDIEVAYVGLYASDLPWVLTGSRLEAADAKDRAKYYLDAMEAKWNAKGGQVRTYIGVYPVDLNGLIQQVSWSVGGGGPTTTASTNTEHNANVPPYYVRRRNENLPPDAQAALANLIDRERVRVTAIGIAVGRTAFGGIVGDA